MLKASDFIHPEDEAALRELENIPALHDYKINPLNYNEMGVFNTQKTLECCHRRGTKIPSRSPLCCFCGKLL